MNMKTTIFNLIGCAAMAVAAVSCTDNGRAEIEEMRAGFVSPPASSRPGVYWYFMDGNMDKESMTRDLESMKDAGIGSVVFLEVNAGVPRGSVDFMSAEWKACFVHAVRECERLGITMTLGTAEVRGSRARSRCSILFPE